MSENPSAPSAPSDPVAPADTSSAAKASAAGRMTGAGRVLVAVYGILAVAATGRSVYQIVDHFSLAPIAFTLSAFSALVYIVATVALIVPGRVSYRVAWTTISIELAGVLIVGTITTFAPELFGSGVGNPFGDNSTVWSTYGAGYLFIPLVLPVLGMLWLARHRPAPVSDTAARA